MAGEPGSRLGEIAEHAVVGIDASVTSAQGWSWYNALRAMVVAGRYEAALRNSALALERKPARGMRHSIIHANIPGERALEAMAAMQREFDAGYPEPSPSFTWWIGDIYASTFGPGRSLRLNPLATYLRKGIRWASGSDFDVTPFPARYGIWSSIAREPLLAIPLVTGLLVALGALLLRLGGIAFGEPTGSAAPAEGSHIPMFAHLGLVLVAGIWLPPPLVAWFQNVAGLLG